MDSSFASAATGLGEVLRVLSRKVRGKPDLSSRSGESADRFPRNLFQRPVLPVPEKFLRARQINNARGFGWCGMDLPFCCFAD
jgi:hypothetical protein